METSFIFSIIVLIMSVVVHEVAHGYTAEALGDPTARLEGRLTLNPIKHIDPIGSILVPLITFASGVTFGWAKPVPFNPYNLKHRKSGEALIALAGPVSNLLIALIFSIIIRNVAFISPGFFEISLIIIITNIGLAIFNLVPIPPLDGSKILFALIPYRYDHVREWLERYSFVLVIILIFFLWHYIAPIIPWVFGIFTGIHL